MICTHPRPSSNTFSIKPPYLQAFRSARKEKEVVSPTANADPHAAADHVPVASSVIDEDADLVDSIQDIHLQAVAEKAIDESADKRAAFDKEVPAKSFTDQLMEWFGATVRCIIVMLLYRSRI